MVKNLEIRFLSKQASIKLITERQHTRNIWHFQQNTESWK